MLEAGLKGSGGGGGIIDLGPGYRCEKHGVPQSISVTACNVPPSLLPVLSIILMVHLDAGWWPRRGMWSTSFTSATLLRMRTTPRAACAPRPRATRRCAASSPTLPSSSEAGCKHESWGLWVPDGKQGRPGGMQDLPQHHHLQVRLGGTLFVGGVRVLVAAKRCAAFSSTLLLLSETGCKDVWHLPGGWAAGRNSQVGNKGKKAVGSIFSISTVSKREGEQAGLVMG